jgi:hypothetical protein
MLRPANRRDSASPLLPDAALWQLPDLELLHSGQIRADQLHPLIAAALVPEHRPAGPPRPDRDEGPRLVECRGRQHRIGLVDETLTAMDHDLDEIRREQLLVALGGPPSACLRAIDEAHRSPDCIADVRARLDHGDNAGAIAAVERLLGPDVLLRDGVLRDELEIAALRRINHGLFRAGLPGRICPPRIADDRRRFVRSRPRHALSR